VRAGGARPRAPCPRGEGERACEAVARESWPVSLSLFLSHSTLSLPASSSPARPSCTHRRIKVVMAMVTGVAGVDEKSVRVCGRKEGGGHGQQKAEPVFCARRAMPSLWRPTGSAPACRPPRTPGQGTGRTTTDTIRAVRGVGRAGGPGAGATGPNLHSSKTRNGEPGLSLTCASRHRGRRPAAAARARRAWPGVWLAARVAGRAGDGGGREGSVSEAATAPVEENVGVEGCAVLRRDSQKGFYTTHAPSRCKPNVTLSVPLSLL